MPAANNSFNDFDEAMSNLRDLYNYHAQSGLIVICGDFNVHVIEGPQSYPSVNADPRRANLLNRFLSDTNQISLITSDYCQGPLLTYYPYDGGHGSQIDHVLMGYGDTRDLLKEVYVHGDHSLNTSDHVPITASIKCYLASYSACTRSLYRWDRTDKLRYKQELDQVLRDNDMTNTSISEETDIDQLCEKLVKCIVDVSNIVVPTSQYCPHKKPYWSPELKALHVNQKQLRRVWIEEGRPRGPVYMSYVNYKKAKHIFAKTLKTQALMYEQKQFHDVSMSRDMNIKQFWKYIRRNRNHQENISVMRDEEKTYVTPEQQLDMWKTHFGTILNESEYESAQYDKEFKTEIEHNVQVMKNTMDKYSQPSSVNLANISVNEVKQVCMSLSPGKAPGVDRLTYEHFKYAGNVFFETLTVLYNNILHYVHIPPHFKEGLLVTIYKGHGKPKDKKDSYRGVTLLPAINKVFEKCIFNRIQPFFDHIKFPPPLQNASRKGISNVMVSFMANEAIYSCTEKGGKVFACLLDIEKCFDKLWWDGLLFKMHKIGFDNKMWFLMYDWFQGSNCRVCFNGHVSDAFNITRSIKQGGILSMINLCIFMYDIHNSIDEHSDLGLCCNDIYVGSPTFADDVMLLSSTKNNLDKMMANAWVYSQKWRFTFSLTKSKCMVFGESKRNHLANVRHRIFNLGNHVLQEVSHYDHLGVKLCAYDSSRERTNDACQKGNRSLAALTPCGTKGNGLYPYVSSFLWNRLCIPAMLHGCEVWYELDLHVCMIFVLEHAYYFKHAFVSS
jgi:hypothetical protein